MKPTVLYISVLYISEVHRFESGKFFLSSWFHVTRIEQSSWLTLSGVLKDTVYVCGILDLCWFL